jgi:RNA polymerase sigma-70 factor (ECF subfamily)
VIGGACKDDIAAPFARSRQRSSDAELIEAIASGDQHAFGLLYRRTDRLVLSLALRVCRERALAEEAVQEACFAIWRRAHQFDRNRGEARSWIAAIVHNAAVDTLRRRDGTLAADEDVLAAIPEEVDEGDAARDELEADLRALLLLLPGEQSSVIELFYFGGYSLVEVASMSSMPLGTVKSRMRLGIEKLRTQIVMSDSGA